MKKPARMARRAIRRALRGKGKCRGKGECQRRRLQGRGALAFLAPLTGPQDIAKFLGADRRRRHASWKGKGRRGKPKDASGKTTECDICHSTRHFRRECPQGDGRGR
eukprot:8667517-Pyramimonas_sp.AAC.1